MRVAGRTSRSTWFRTKRASIDCSNSCRMPPGRSMAACRPSGEPIAVISKLGPMGVPSI
jgi:hypothetical protein